MAQGKRWDVLGLGAVTVDDLVYVDQYPQPGTKLLVRERRREGGGLTGTALVAAARLGARSAYCGVLGKDELSLFTLLELEREGVDCSQIARRAEARPIHSTVIVERSSGQRTILYWNARVIEPEPQEITEDMIAACRVLLVDHTMARAGLHAARLAHARLVPVVGDIEKEPEPRALDLMDQIDHLIVSTRFAGRVTGKREPQDMVRALSRPERACCVVTDGEQGCWYLREHGGDVHHLPALPVQAVDTTGCGDVFHGAYAACLAQGASVHQAIKVATVAAGLKATQPGGRSGIPDRATIDCVLAANEEAR
jgi:sulfofructose kinase